VQPAVTGHCRRVRWSERAWPQPALQQQTLQCWQRHQQQQWQALAGPKWCRADCRLLESWVRDAQCRARDDGSSPTACPSATGCAGPARTLVASGTHSQPRRGHSAFGLRLATWACWHCRQQCAHPGCCRCRHRPHARPRLGRAARQPATARHGGERRARRPSRPARRAQHWR
jgi:hypothetical protein